jgi:carbonic anhydrase
MERRNLIKGLALLGLCPLCTTSGFAAEGAHWTYEGESGPDHWGAMGPENAACSVGSQQSPLDISGAITAELPDIAIAWNAGDGTIINNGHTIQVNVAAGSKLTRGDRTYELLQFHFHAPSEHKVHGKTFPMEVHFVHKNAATGALGVLGVFMAPGADNAVFAGLAATFPADAGKETAAAVDPRGLLPGKLGYWTYEGSLTTPPCSEIVDWMVAMEPIEVAAADIERFTTLYAMNARPALAPNRRFILGSL